MRSSSRYCVTCGKKFYPKSYSAYPQDEYEYHSSTGQTVRYIVQPIHKHFHSQSCMKEWIAKHSQSFSHLVDTISYNVIEDNSNQEKG